MFVLMVINSPIFGYFWFGWNAIAFDHGIEALLRYICSQLKFPTGSTKRETHFTLLIDIPIWDLGLNFRYIVPKTHSSRSNFRAQMSLDRGHRRADDNLAWSWFLGWKCSFLRLINQRLVRLMNKCTHCRPKYCHASSFNTKTPSAFQQIMVILVVRVSCTNV